MANKPLIEKGWIVEGVSSAAGFFMAATRLLPLPVHIYFEGTSISNDVWTLLNSRAVSPGMKIPRGTILPIPRRIHVLATEEFLQQVADIASGHAEPEICDHLCGILSIAFSDRLV